MRAVAWADGEIGERGTKTLNALLRLGRIYEIVAVIDRQHCGQLAGPLVGMPEPGPPIVAALSEALTYQPEVLILSDLPFDQITSFSPHIRSVIIEALMAGLDVINTQHAMLQDDREIVDIAAYHRRRLIDLRRSPPRAIWKPDTVHQPPLVILSAGVDSAVGKMTTGWMLVQRLKALGVAAQFVATGQIGILIGADVGAAIDHIETDFAAGIVSMLLAEAAKNGATIAIVEGQGAIRHPAFGGVALSILHGAAPHAVILSFETGRVYRRYFSSVRCPTVDEEWQAICQLAPTPSPPQLIGVSGYGGELPPQMVVGGTVVPVINSFETVEPLAKRALSLLPIRQRSQRTDDTTFMEPR